MIYLISIPVHTQRLIRIKVPTFAMRRCLGIHNVAPAFHLKDFSFQDHCLHMDRVFKHFTFDATQNDNYYLCLMLTLSSIVRLKTPFRLTKLFYHYYLSRSDLRSMNSEFQIIPSPGNNVCASVRTQTQI